MAIHSHEIEMTQVFSCCQLQSCKGLHKGGCSEACFAHSNLCLVLVPVFLGPLVNITNIVSVNICQLSVAEKKTIIYAWYKMNTGIDMAKARTAEQKENESK